MFFFSGVSRLQAQFSFFTPNLTLHLEPEISEL